jgi:hypothetical protein
MGRRKARRAGLLALGAALMALSVIVVASASATKVRAGNLEIEIEGGFSPKKLSKKTPTPITLKLEGAIKTADGTHPPALKTLDLEFDKHGAINTKGLPTCTAGKLASTLTAQAKKACGPSQVGSGRAYADIALPEQPEFPAQGPLLIFNGPPKGGNPTLLMHVYALAPAPTTIVASAVITKVHGKYGTRALVTIPKIVNGQGSLTKFKATLSKTWSSKGKKQHLLTATCPTGSLFAHGEFDFTGGDKIEGDIAKKCTPGK